MTNEEAINRLEWALKNNTIYDVEEAFEYILAVKKGIEALEQGSILDKIRAEIETDLSHFCFDDWGNETIEWKEVKAIIDKYKTESEEI